MSKANIRRYVFKVSLIFILILSVFLSIYAVKNYKGNNLMGQNNLFQREGNVSGNWNMPQPNSNISSRNNGDYNQEDSNGNDQRAIGNINNNRQRGNNRNMQSGQFNKNIPRGSADTKYLQLITIYSIIFLVLTCGVYYLAKRKKIKVNLLDEKLVLITLLGTGFFLRIAASTLMNGHNDINLFRSWAQVAANGPSQFYSNARQADYPPLYMYVLAIIGKLASFSALNPYYVLLLKIPSIAADVISGYFIYKLGKKHFESWISILLAAFYIFNPAVFIDSTFWGQVDSFFTLLIVISVYLLCEKKYVFSSIMFIISALMKPQGIIFLPILFFELVRQKKVKNFIYCGISAIVAALIIIIPFALSEQNPLWIFSLYSKTISEYPYASVNAFNFFSLIGANYKNDNTTLFIFSYHTMGMIFIVMTTLFGWYIYIRGKGTKYVSAIALLQIAGVFTFSVGMHERYLFPAVALAILAFMHLKDKRFFILAIGFSITSYTNIVTVLFSTNTSLFNIFLKATSFVNVILVIYLVKVLLDNVAKNKISSELIKNQSEAL